MSATAIAGAAAVTGGAAAAAPLAAPLMAGAIAAPIVAKAAGGIIGNLVTRKEFKAQLAQNKEDQARMAQGKLGISNAQRRTMLSQANSAMRNDQREVAVAQNGMKSGFDLQKEQQDKTARASATGQMSQGIDQMSQQQAVSAADRIMNTRNQLMQQQAARWSLAAAPVGEAAGAAGSYALANKAGMDQDRYFDTIGKSYGYGKSDSNAGVS